MPEKMRTLGKKPSRAEMSNLEVKSKLKEMEEKVKDAEGELQCEIKSLRARQSVLELKIKEKKS